MIVTWQGEMRVNELLAIFPELAEQEVPFLSARLCLKADGVQVLLAA